MDNRIIKIESDIKTLEDYLNRLKASLAAEKDTPKFYMTDLVTIKVTHEEYEIVMAKDKCLLGSAFDGKFHPTDSYEEIAYNKIRKLYDGQPVLCWDGIDTHLRHIMFYDAVNDSVFSYGGGKRVNIDVCTNVEALPISAYSDWVYEAYTSLVRG